ncbi:MAG: hypothetical protein IH591_10135 [Bacteroidales bacterium]|nr:hypothetical protein [Bacteroidales bacterium]
MSEENKRSDSKNDEIDLLDLFTRMGRGIGKMLQGAGRAMLYVIFFLLRKWLWLGLSVALGIGASFLIKFSTERLYSSDAILSSNTIDNADMIGYVNKLHTYCREANFAELAAALSVEQEKVDFIKDIQAYWVIDRGDDNIPDYVDFKNRHNVLDTINVRMQDRFVIRVKTSIPKELTSIRDGIVSYANKNQLYQRQNDLRLQQNRILLARFDYEIDQLDSLQKVKYFEESRRLMPREGGQMIFLQENKTQLLHDDIYSLIQRRQYIETQITIYADLVTLISDFTSPAKAENGALYYGRIVIPLFFGLAVLLLLLFDNRKRLREVYKRY